jgi:hypothetical protein
MGAETSQQRIVDFEDVTQNRTLNIADTSLGKLFRNSPDTPTRSITSAMTPIQDILLTFDEPVAILEIGSGNGFNTREIATLDNIKSLIASDIYPYETQFYPTQTQSSNDAVKNHNDDIDILLLVHPPPGQTYMDYYGIKEYELKNQTRPKYIIFLGELGASDGSEGIYQYLMGGVQSGWKLVNSVSYSNMPDLFGGMCDKRVYLFKLTELNI